MSGPTSPVKILHADPEHGGIRLAALLTLFLGFVGGYLLVRVLLGRFAQGSVLLEFAAAVSCVAAIPIALGCAWLVERTLRKTWTSGLDLRLAGMELRFNGDTLVDGSESGLVLDFAKRVNRTCWRFKLAGYPKAGRERLVSDKWLCLACQMQQDDSRIIAYTYVSPDKAQEWIDDRNPDKSFHEISLARLYKEAGRRRLNTATRPDIPPEMLAGPDGRYWIAERRRWAEGLELTPDDFAALLAFVGQAVQSGQSD